jgi:hypothetical protein
MCDRSSVHHSSLLLCTWSCARTTRDPQADQLSLLSLRALEGKIETLTVCCAPGAGRQVTIGACVNSGENSFGRKLDL